MPPYFFFNNNNNGNTQLRLQNQLPMILVHLLCINHYYYYKIVCIPKKVFWVFCTSTVNCTWALDVRIFYKKAAAAFFWCNRCLFGNFQFCSCRLTQPHCIYILLHAAGNQSSSKFSSHYIIILVRWFGWMVWDAMDTNLFDDG